VVTPGQNLYYAENQAVGALLGFVGASDDVGVTGFRFSDSLGGRAGRLLHDRGERADHITALAWRRASKTTTSRPV